MANPNPVVAEDERLPLILGFQPLAENTARQTSFAERGRGIYVYDTDGHEYIEATASFYVAALGYQHEELIDAIVHQYRELPFYVSALHRTSRSALELAEKLVGLVPVKNAHMLFAATGSEANDFLIKMLRFGAVARGEPQRTTIIGRHGSYHGGTLAAASLTGGHHEEFGLPIAGFRHVAQPDFHGLRLPGESGAEYSARLGRELETLIATEPANSIAAMFCEPVSFSAGMKPPPAEYFPTIARILDAHGIALVADEVITGCGRTGSWWGCETFGLAPAHMTLAKGVTSGYFPLSAIAIGDALYADLERGSERFGTLAHAATYAAHPVGAAAALKTLEIIERDGLIAHGARMGAVLEQGLGRLRAHPLVGDLRACGLACALDFLRRDADDRPINDDADAVLERVYRALLARGVVARPTSRSLVIAPPLIIRADEVEEICRRVALALDDALADAA